MPQLPEEPLNREPDAHELIQSFITDDSGYDRNHSLHPQIDGDSHRVVLDGLVSQQLSLSIKDLEESFEQHSVVCALQCAGNRRHTMRSKLKEVNGIDWFDAAVMNCKWSGPRLKDILDRAGVSSDDGHVAFACNATECQEDTWYGASIPLSRAMDADMEVILALRMNDKPLTVERGYPVRVVIPGIAGARAVKWLDRITVQKDESKNHYMVYDYKVLPEEAVDAESAEKYWDNVPPIQDMPVNSVIGLPQNESTVRRDQNGTISIQGYALPGGADGPVIKVEVSADDGDSWQEVELLHHPEESKWSWKLWRARVFVEPGENRSIYSRATDAGGNTQPANPKWNLRGVCYNGYGDATGLTIV